MGLGVESFGILVFYFVGSFVRWIKKKLFFLICEWGNGVIGDLYFYIYGVIIVSIRIRMVWYSEKILDMYLRVLY